VGLKLVFLVVTRAVAVLGLSRREAWWKDAEILMVRHEALSVPNGGGRPLSPCRRSGGVKLEAA
jgi:hypothetical protein